MSKVIHEEYLRAYLDGKPLERNWKYNTIEKWTLFDSENMSIATFNDGDWEFRYTPKVVEVNLDDFYAEYDSCTSTNHKDIFLEELIEKYLPRGDKR